MIPNGALSGGSVRFAALAARAYEYLCAVEGRAGQSDLVRELFGPAAKGPFWTKLLGNVLAGDARFQRAPGGEWFLPGWEVPVVPLAEARFVVLDVETTGARPGRQRIFDLAALRLAGDAVESAFAATLNPGGRFPSYLSDLTGYGGEQLAEAPAFQQVAADLLDFLGDAVLVGHGLARGLAHLNSELGACGLPPLANRVLDTLDLAQRYLPKHGKPTLDHLARRFALPVGRRHRALPDAYLVAGVFARLLALARSAGVDALADLPLAGPAQPGAPLLLDRSALEDVPTGPGVYLLQGDAGQVLYVGKAANLRSRLASYFASAPEYLRRMEGLLESVADCQTVELGSELEALLEEARLIAQHRPRFNVQLRSREGALFLRLDLAATFPRLTESLAPAPDGARYYGPFASEKDLRHYRRLLEGLFPLASCRRDLEPRAKGRRRTKPCAKLAAGRCLGPCVRPLGVGLYWALVEEMVQFLAGDSRLSEARVRGEIADRRERGDRKGMERLRRLLLAAQQVEPPGQTAESPPANLAVAQPDVNPDSVVLFLLRRGCYAGRLAVAPAEEVATLAERLRATAPLADDDAGRAAILRRWLARNPEAALPLPEGEAGWLAAAERICAAAAELVDYGSAPGRSVDWAEEDMEEEND